MLRVGSGRETREPWVNGAPSSFFKASAVSPAPAQGLACVPNTASLALSTGHCMSDSVCSLFPPSTQHVSLPCVWHVCLACVPEGSLCPVEATDEGCPPFLSSQGLREPRHAELRRPSPQTAPKPNSTTRDML